MVDPDRLRTLLSRLRERREQLREYESLSLDRYLESDRARAASKYYLLTAVEAVLAIANHVIASEGFRSPEDYADAFAVLVGNDVLENRLGERLQAMARFRNVLVHVYAEVDDERVHGYLERRLSDLDEFAAQVLRSFPEVE